MGRITFIITKCDLDIGANLTDAMYQGIYNGSQKHQPDLDNVLERAINNGIKKIIITGTDLVSSRLALQIALKNGMLILIFYLTVILGDY